MSDPLVPARVVDAAVAAIGPVRILVSSHAKSGGDGSPLDMTPDNLDIHWQINTKVDALAQPALHRAVPRGGCGRVKKRSDARIGHNSV